MKHSYCTNPPMLYAPKDGYFTCRACRVYAVAERARVSMRKMDKMEKRLGDALRRAKRASMKMSAMRSKVRAWR